MTEQCACGRDISDRYVCEVCSDELSKALGDIPWLDDELETTITKRKGIDYRRVGGGKGGKTAQPSPPEWTASNARDNLRAVLVAWVRFCAEEHVRNQSPHQGIPEDTLPAISRWLMWRVDGLALHDIGPEAVDEITSAVAHCHRLIDRPADRQYLGQHCEGGRLYARPGGAMARCNVCREVVDAESLRTKLLSELDDRLCTASEIAKLSTYLGLKSGRDQTRKTIEHWARKGRIQREASISDVATYRFGEVYAELVRHELRRPA